MSTRTEVAAAIVALRCTYQETQRRFSERLGVTLPTVGRWEISDRQPSVPYLGRLWILAKRQRRPDLEAIFAAAFALKMRCSVSTGLKLLEEWEAA